MSAVVQVDRLCKTYRVGMFRRTVTALREVTLQVPAGCVFGLLGPNRAGKTTLIKIILGLTRPTAGTVWRWGRPGEDRSNLARIGYMHENHAFPSYLTAAEILQLYGGLSGVPYEQLRQRVPQLLEQVGLADRPHEPVQHYSKGMVQRLGLAQALVNDPELLVLDEPGEGLDLYGRQLLRDIVEQWRRRGRTVLVASHDLAAVEQWCDQAAVLNEGRLLACGPLEGLRQAAGTPLETLETVLDRLYSQARAA